MPSYSGSHKSYFFRISGLTNLSHLLALFTLKASRYFAHLPPIKCLPLKYFTNGFGAVKLTNTSGLNLAPGPSFGGPSSIFQDEGASTDVTGIRDSSNARMTAGKGSRTSPEKENPGYVIRRH
jgi:hypothetical protein